MNETVKWELIENMITIVSGITYQEAKEILKAITVGLEMGRWT